jgi:hypothetical protein
VADKPLRFAPPVTAELTVPGRMLTAVACKVVDLTLSGADFLLGEPLDKGTGVQLCIIYPELKEGLELKGTVVRAVAPPPVANAKDWIIGVDFGKVTPDARKQLEKWRKHALSTMVRRRNEDKRRDFGLAGPGPDGIR